jgi:hypothetical protein
MKNKLVSYITLGIACGKRDRSSTGVSRLQAQGKISNHQAPIYKENDEDYYIHFWLIYYFDGANLSWISIADDVRSI